MPTRRASDEAPAPRPPSDAAPLVVLPTAALFGSVEPDGTDGGPTEILGNSFVFWPQAGTWQASPSDSWIALKNASGAVTNPIAYTLAENPDDRREGRITVTLGGTTRTLAITQAGGRYIKFQDDQLLGAPVNLLSIDFNPPLIIEFGILLKYLAQEIQKIPVPFDLIALLVVELLIPVLAELVVLFRDAFKTVPQPASAFRTNVIVDTQTKQYIWEQALMSMIYLAVEVLTGE